MVNVTATTCEYGLAQSRAGCVTTLAQLCGNAYVATQLVYFAAGVLALTVSGYKLACAFRYHGAAVLQKQIFALCMFAAFTVLARGVDPGSYGHYTPRPISGFLTDACTATLYTIFIKTVIFYVSITQHGVVEKRRSIVVFERVTLAIIWAFYVAYDVSLLQDKGFGGIRGSVQLYVSAGFLLFLSASFLVLGLQVIRRLEAIETMASHRLVTTALARADGSRVIDYNSSSDDAAHAVLEEVKPEPRKPADRIRLMLAVTETVALLSVAAQVAMAVLRGRAPPLELECANGVHCEQIAMKVNLLHVFQYIWVWLTLWAYWRTQPRSATKVSVNSSSDSSRRKTPFGADQSWQSERGDV